MGNHLLDKLEKVQISELDSSKTYLLKLKFTTKLPKETVSLIFNQYKKLFEINNIRNIIITYETTELSLEITDITPKQP